MLPVPFFIFLGLFPACEYLDIFGFFDPAVTTDGGEEQAQNFPTRNRAAAGEEAVEEEEDVYSYNASGKKDPFRTFLSQGADPIPTDSFRRGPLQKYDVGQYEIQGIIWGIDRARALVKDPDGEGHVMELGTYVGKNWGKVTSIEECVVVVTEEYQTRDGELMITPITLRLRPEEQCKEL
jgi:type IV pilus assembly protein PilP